MPARMTDQQSKTIVTQTVSRAYLQKLSRQNYLATTLVAILVTLSLFWLLFHLGGKNTLILFGNGMYVAASFIGTFLTGTTAYRMRFGPLKLEPRLQLAWLLISMGLFAGGLGDSYYMYQEYTGHYNPVPSYADIGFTLFHIFTFIGLLLISTIAKPERLPSRIALDAIITTLCILGVSWYFVIYPIYTSLKNNPHFIPELVIVVSYPLWDVLLILAIVLLILQRTERALHPSLLLCAIGILSLIWADTGFALTVPFNTYTTGTFYIDTFWFIGFLLIGLSGPYQYAKLARKAYSERTNPNAAGNSVDYSAFSSNKKSRRRLILIQSLLIYIPLAVLLTLMLESEVTRESDALSFFLVVLTAIVGVLVAIRYLLATQENEKLLQERELERVEAEHLRQLSTRLAEVIELDPLLTRIVTLAASELAFDAVTLLLFEDYEHTPETQSSLLIRVATVSPQEITTLRIEAPRLHHCTALLGKEIEIIWHEQIVHLPLEIRTILEEQHIQATLFVPLIYQGKILGSIGYSCRTTKQYGYHVRYRAHAFTELAAAALEHAHLYETARKQEQFSKALGNIATLLNRVLAEPSDIHQLICIEGANALQADYALLYVANENGQLVPLATFSGEQEPPLKPGDWPYIRQNDFEIQALSLLQPTLVVFDQLSSSGSLPAISGKIPSMRDPSAQGTLPTALSTFSTLGGVREKQTSSLRGALIRRYVHAAILAPLIAQDDPVGLLVIARTRRPGQVKKKSYLISDLAQAQDFAEQAAVAFTNAHLYQQLRNAHERLQELDQLKDQFMVTASHELRTPLTAVQGYLELIAQYREVLPPDQLQEFLLKARRGCDELVLLLHNLMDASRLEVEAGIRPANIEAVQVKEMIQSIIDLLEPQLKQEKREVYINIPADFYVLADPGRLRQILLNISTNALKYSPAGTLIAFSAYSTSEADPGGIISVTDKGKGIKPQDQAFLFQRFVRLERDLNSSVRGSGLGLYISRRLIEAMGGRIWIESTGIPGAGSTFHIQLPLA